MKRAPILDTGEDIPEVLPNDLLLSIRENLHHYGVVQPWEHLRFHQTCSLLYGHWTREYMKLLFEIILAKTKLTYKKTLHRECIDLQFRLIERLCVLHFVEESQELLRNMMGVGSTLASLFNEKLSIGTLMNPYYSINNITEFTIISILVRFRLFIRAYYGWHVVLFNETVVKDEDVKSTSFIAMKYPDELEGLARK